MIHIPFPRSRANPVAAEERLNEFHRKPAGNCIRNNKVDIHYDLQIIVPAYNAENTIEECLDSALNQNTAYQYIITVINDGSNDATRTKLDKYQDNSKVEIIHQENRGFSGARNRGLEVLKGTYIAFLDSDDKLPSYAIQDMIEIAFRTNADMVQGGWYEFGNGRSVYQVPGQGEIATDTADGFSGYPWGKVYKYTVLEKFQFPEGYWFEDTPISFLLEALPLRFVLTDKVVYEYRINPNGITQKAAYSPKSVDSYWITEQCLENLSKFGLAYDQRAYEYFIKQVVTNYLRTRKMPQVIKKSIFVLTANCYEKFFKDKYTVSEIEYKGLEKAIRRKSYIQYELSMIQFR